MTVSDGTRAWEVWRARRRGRRRLLSWSGSVILAALLVAGLAWGGFQVFNVGERGEAVAVKLGNPDGEDLPLSVSAVTDQAMQAVMTAQRDLSKTTAEETRVSVPSRPAPSAPDPTKPAPTDKPAVTEKVIRGSEKGNSSEVILKPQGEKISQNGWTPVYLYMPLPTKLDAGLLARIKGSELFTAEERRDLLLQVYARNDDALTLTSDPGLAVRPALWEILEGAGYDVVNAEYKQGGTLKAVVLSFQLGVPKATNANPELLDVKLEQSSGNGAVDEAVLFAFRKSTFANGTGQQAEGRYTYDFSGKK